MFRFRLQKLLDHRGLLEDEAKKHFLERKAAKLTGERELVEVRLRRSRLETSSAVSVLDRLDLEGRFSKADDDERAAIVGLGVLQDEEDAAEKLWLIAKKELQVIEKLRERRYDEWQVEESRREQNALDEWAVLRRVA